jgi:glycosyltransferase involved in cell wall biosynthesis
MNIQKKKILIFSTAYYPFVGGAEVAIKEIVDRIANGNFPAQGATPDIALRSQGGRGPASGWEFHLITAQMDGQLPKIECMGNITVHRFGVGIPFVDKYLLALFGHKFAQKLHKENNYSLAWSIMASQASIAASFFKKKTGGKLLLTLQEGDEEKHLKRYVFGISFLYKILIRPWHLFVFKNADVLTAISHDLKQRAIKNGVKNEINIVPNGVDIEKFSQRFSGEELNNFKNELSLQENDKLIITTSRLVKKNAVGDVIKAMKYLPENYKFLILGTGKDEKDLKRKAKNLKLDDRILFLGQVDHKDLLKYLQISDVFIRPSLSEGLGNSFLEAMAAGLPVIATPVGGIPDFLVPVEMSPRVPLGDYKAPTGLFCEVRSPKSVAEKIKFILDPANENLKNQIIANAQQLVQENYNWDKIAQKMRDIFERILKL